MKPTEHVLVEILQEMFETLAFISLGDPPAAKVRNPDAVRVHVGFTGAARGEIWLEVPGAMLAELAANMLGLDESGESSREQGLDALGELANVICGNLLARLAGPEPIFNLAAPRIEAKPPFEDKPPAGTRTDGGLGLESGAVRLSLFLEETGEAGK